MDRTVYVAGAFSKNSSGGNKAGVVFDDKSLTVFQKKSIAKELGYAETVFISESKIADFKFEYFTPKEEVDLCGHATIAAFVILKYLKLSLKKNYTIKTNSGIFEVKIKDEEIFMEQTKPAFGELLNINKFENCFDLTYISDNYPIQIVSTGLKDILLPIKSEELLHRLTPNFEGIKELSSQLNVIGIHAYTLLDDEIVMCRNFAPLYDINEEAATGTSNAALACYLYNRNILKKEKYLFEQGYTLNSPSQIIVKLLTNTKKGIEKVYVGGTGYYCETKKLRLLDNGD